MESEHVNDAPLDADLASLLTGYGHVLRIADSVPAVRLIRAGDGRWLRRVPILVSSLYVRPLVAAHARQRVLALERALHYEVATGGASTAGGRPTSIGCLEHFRQSLPEVPTRRYLVSFLAGVLACALAISNVARALAPAELDRASRAMGDLAGAIVSVNTDELIAGAHEFTIASAVAAAVVATLSLQLVALLPLGSFRLKRILFNHHPASPADVAAARAAVERRRAAGLYDLEARVYAAHELPEPRERALDVAASAVLAVFPLLLGIAVAASDEPRRVLLGADYSVVRYGLLPASLLLLIALPAATLHHLNSVLAERRRRVRSTCVYRCAQLAPRHRRALAALVDVVLALLLVFGGLAVLGTAGKTETDGAWVFFVMMPLSLTAVTVPFMLRGGGRAGQSLGKQVLGVRVVDAAGGSLRPSQVVVRDGIVKSLLLFGLAALLLWTPVVIDCVKALRDPERRSLEDRVSATRVVRASAAVATPAADHRLLARGS